MNKQEIEKNWPNFDGVKALSPSSISKLLAYILYGKVDKKRMQYAFKNGNEIERGFYSYHSLKEEGLDVKQRYAFALMVCKSPKKRKDLAKLIFWFDKKYPTAKLLSYQRIVSKEPYACILDFEFSVNGKVLIFDVKTNNRVYRTPLQSIMWDIQFYIQNYCTNTDVNYIWCNLDKEKDITITFNKWKYPNYDLKNLITLLKKVNSLMDWNEINQIILDFHVEAMKDYFNRNNIKWEKE